MRRGSNPGPGSKSKRGSTVSSRRGSFQLDAVPSQHRRGSFDKVVAVLNLDKLIPQEKPTRTKIGIISASDFHNSALGPVSSGNGGKENQRVRRSSGHNIHRQATQAMDQTEVDFGVISELLTGGSGGKRVVRVD